MAFKRLFLAIDMPPEIEQIVGKIQKHFEHKKLFEGRWVHPKQMHLTLKFLGDTSPEMLTQIQKKLAALRLPEFEVTLGGLGLFSSRQFIRILYLNLVSTELEDLAQTIEQTIEEFVPKEARPFASHVTLARIKSVHDREKFLQEVELYKVPEISLTVDSFAIKESIMKPDGVEYWDVARFELTKLDF